MQLKDEHTFYKSFVFGDVIKVIEVVITQREIEEVHPAMIQQLKSLVDKRLGAGASDQLTIEAIAAEVIKVYPKLDRDGVKISQVIDGLVEFLRKNLGAR